MKTNPETCCINTHPPNIYSTVLNILQDGKNKT